MVHTRVFIGGFTYELGEDEHHIDDLPELNGKPEQLLMLKDAGFEYFRISNLSVLELAGKAIEKFFAKTSIPPAEIDAVVFATSSMGISNHLSHYFLCNFLLQHKLENAYPLISSLSFCGNFLPALEKGYNYIQTGQFKNVLVVVSDIIPVKSSRLAPPDVALGSDGAACCLLSVNNFSNFEISSINQAVNVRSGLMDPDKDFARYVKAVGDGIKKVTSRSLATKENARVSVTKIFTNNYSINVCKSYLRLIRIPEDKIDLVNIGRFGHAGAADICINISDYLASVKTTDKEAFLLLSSGPFMWGSALIQELGSN